VTAALLPPRLLGQLGQHQLVPRRRIAGRYQGGHRSVRTGASVEFADVREYVAGDDPRRVDIAASRRHGRLQVTLTEAEDDAAAQLVVDASASMGGERWEAAARLVAGLAVLGARDGVRVWAASRRDGEDTLVARTARGAAALAAVTAVLEDVAPPVVAPLGSPTDGAAPTAAGRPDLLGALGRAVTSSARGPLVLISDLLFPDWVPLVDRLAAARADVLVLQVLGVADLDPVITDDLRLVDAESGVEVEVSSHEHVLAAYRAVLDAHLDAVTAACARRGAAHLVVRADEDPAEVLLHRLAVAGFVR
jgi:uncharacterized protein (DUF58 family)